MSTSNFFARRVNAVRFFCFAFLCLLIGFVFAAQMPRVQSAIEIPGANLPIASPSPPPEQPHNVVAAYYDVQNFPGARLLLNNKGLQALEVRPTLYNLDGISMELASVTVEANSHRFINLSDWADLGGESFRRGSLKLFHTGKDLVMGSQIYLENESQSLSFEERLVELGKFDSRRLEGIWYMPRNQTQVTIILSNTSNEMISVTARLSKNPHQSGQSQTILLQPHQTRVLDLRNDFPDGDNFASGKIIGLSLEHTGGTSALKAHGQVKDAPKGYSNIISFTNPNTGKSSELHGTGLHLGTFGNENLEPVVAVKNVGTGQASVTARVPYTRTNGTTGTVNLSSFSLKQGEMRLLNMASVIQRSQQEQIEIAGIEISYDTAPGSVIVSAQSINQNLRLNFRVPMGDPYALSSSTGGYPWRIDETSSTFAYIKNTTDTEQEYVAVLTWNGGDYSIGLKPIAPHQTVQIDVKKLRDNQTPDQRGITIPGNIDSGQIKWTIRSEKYLPDQPLQKFEMTGRSEQIDTVKGISSSYACHNCCQKIAWGWIESGGVNEAEVGDQIQFTAWEEGYDCYGYHYPPYQYPNNKVNWDSSNDDVATVDNGLVTVVRVGNVEIDGEWLIDVSTDYGGWCPMLTENVEIKAIESEQDFVPDCNWCQTGPNWIGSDVDITVSPTVTLNVPTLANDGSNVTFSVTTEGGTPSSYQWTFTAPTGSGNNPQVNFASSTSASTTATAHWFANPNQACPNAPAESTYTIKCKVTFNNGAEKTKQKSFKVNGAWDPGGETRGARSLTGSAARAADASGTWHVTGIGSLATVPNVTTTVFVPNTSQFFSKADSHENVHVGQWDANGLLGQQYAATVFYNRISGFTASSEQKLLDKIFNEALIFYAAAAAAADALCNQAEIEAYNVSDLLAPTYLYQRCGATTFPNCH